MAVGDKSFRTALIELIGTPLTNILLRSGNPVGSVIITEVHGNYITVVSNTTTPVTSIIPMSEIDEVIE